MSSGARIQVNVTHGPGSVRGVPGVVGVILNLMWVAVLFGICAFDGGSGINDDWRSCVVWCSIMAIPAALAIAGLLRKTPVLLLMAAVSAVPLSFISLAGAGLPLLLPAFAYGLAGTERRTTPR
jgi:hypothetical protein